MPAGSSEVLQEYLVSLGFKTDLVSLKKFDDGLGVVGKRVMNVGGAVAGLILSVEAAAAAFAYSMRKMYFASELSNSSVKNINAMTYAGKQIGIAGDTMAGAIHNMAQAMRLNPGLQGLIESFGVKVTGRDMSDVMVDFVGALKGMPEFAATQYAAMFGIDPDTYHQMINHYDELKKKKGELIDMYKNMGVDPDKAKGTLMEYTQAMDKLEAKLKITAQQALIAFAPLFKQTTEWLNSLADGWTNAFKKVERGTFWEDLKQGFEQTLKDKWKWLGGDSNSSGSDRVKLMFSLDELNKKLEQEKAASAATSSSAIAAAEAKYKLPAGVLDRMWSTESGRGKYMLSPKGAMGHFQFMPNTAKEYGLSDADTGDLGKSSDAAGRKLSNLIKYYNGDVTKAVAAYNWGEGNLDKYGLAKAPAETRDYVSKVLGDTRLGAGASNGPTQVIQNNNFSITGGNAQETAKAVASEQSRVQADLVRNLKSSVL